jgi:hypothetical protein
MGNRYLIILCAYIRVVAFRAGIGRLKKIVEGHCTSGRSHYKCLPPQIRNSQIVVLRVHVNASYAPYFCKQFKPKLKLIYAFPLVCCTR